MRAFHETPKNAAECLILAQFDADNRSNGGVLKFFAEQVAVWPRLWLAPSWCIAQ
jgi:hypothetical protein